MTNLGILAACSIVVLLLCLVTPFDALAGTRFISYLYVEGNEGDSSGGHAALRFDEEIFHFQHENFGIIRIRRIDSTAFNHSYAMLGNRTIRESRIAVSEESFVLLRDGFVKLVLIQEAQLDIIQTLRRDVALFELLLKQTHGGNRREEVSALPLKGVGYFLSDSPDHLQPSENSAVGNNIAEAHPSKALSNLRNSILTTYGERFIEERITQAIVELRTLGLRAARAHLTEISRDIYPKLATSAAISYDNALLALVALEILQSAPELRPGTFRSLDSDQFSITTKEKLHLISFAQQLEGDLVRLVKSSRSDWGFPFIVAMARLASIERSLASGRMVFLDLFPGNVVTQERQTFRGQNTLPNIKNELQQVFMKRREEFFGSMESRESDYAALELVGNQLIEMEYAIASGSAPRRISDAPIPSRSAMRSDLVLPDMSEETMKLELAAARAAEKEYAATITRLYRYDLVRRNCVTEIFTSMNSIFERLSSATEKAGQAIPKELGREESQNRLGGFVDAEHGLTFIPFISAGEVDACYSVVSRQEWPSYRSAQLSDMKKRESPLLVFLRESNTITSTIYRPAQGDSPFLFFTDDTILFRPLFGVFNLLYGLGNSIIGLVATPVAGPYHLSLGLKGMLFSMPELAFINLRKGSMEYVEKTP